MYRYIHIYIYIHEYLLCRMRRILGSQAFFSAIITSALICADTCSRSGWPLPRQPACSSKAAAPRLSWRTASSYGVPPNRSTALTMIDSCLSRNSSTDVCPLLHMNVHVRTHVCVRECVCLQIVKIQIRHHFNESCPTSNDIYTSISLRADLTFVYNANIDQKR